jgi:AcrR family transcriptional regulator
MARTLDLERRSELVQRALDVLRTRGGRMTMTELARALGIKRPTLYFYFRDLTGLLHAAVEDVYRRQVGHLIGRIAAVHHPVLALAELARATVALQRGRRDLVLLLLQLWAAGGSDPEELLARARTATAPLRAELIARLTAGVERGVVAPCDPPRLVDLVLAVIDGVLVQEVTRGAGGAPVVEELWQRVLAPLVIAEADPSQAGRGARRGRP